MSMSVGRRQFLKGATAAALAHGSLASAASRTRLRVGIIGTGLRGQQHLSLLLRRTDVEVAALCDIERYMLETSLKMVEAAGRPKPRIYTGRPDAWRRMLGDGVLDAVIIATPWELHAPQAIAAMESKVAVACEVVAGITLEDHWAVLRAQQRTGTPYMLLENVCYRRDVLAVLNMVRQGLFGEIVHLQGGYEHDLRAVKLNSGVPGKPYGEGVEFGEKGWSESKWRTRHSVTRNGDLYPSHGIGPCAMWANINRGNRFLRLTSYSSKARGLHEYIVENGGAAHPSAQVKFALGDVVTTQIACANGETILLTHDTSLPRPYSLGFRVQGTDGLWMDLNQSIYLEGKSERPHEWEPAQSWLDKYDHPLWKRYAVDATGAGHGGMDFFVLHGFIEALKRKAPMPIDIYDAVAWSAITPLSEQSIAAGNRTLDIPDFTEGNWRTRKPIFALNVTEVGEGTELRIFTIGYEAALMSDFLAALTSAGVKRVIDVRALPLSRRPGFSKTPLRAALAEAGIDYVHLRALGTPPAGREAARKGRHAELERIYAGQLELPEAIAQGAQMLELAAEKPSALLCYEREPSGCHRSLLLDAVAPDAKAEHLYA